MLRAEADGSYHAELPGRAGIIIHVHSAPPPGQDSLQLLLHGLDAAGKSRYSIIQGVHFLLSQVLGQLLVSLVLDHLGQSTIHIIGLGCEG